MTVIELPVRHRASSDATSAITMTIVKSFDASAISRKEWDEFVLDAGGEIYSSYDWCRIWWRHYGDGRDLRLFIFRQQGRLVGLAPMFIERIWLGLLRIRLAKPVGADFAMDVFGLPTLARCPDSLYEQIISELVEIEKCDALWFGFTPAEHHSLEALRRSVDGTKGSVAVVRDTSAGALTLFDLPNNFDSYVAGLGKAARQNFRRQFNLLKKASSVEQVVIQTPIDPEAEFRAFNELHTRQWEAEGLPGHFKDWPGSEAFNQDLITQHSRLGRLRMVRLHSDEKMVASQYAFTFGSTGYWRLAARATEKELARYGLGVLGLMQLLEQMCRDGIQRVEGGFGRYPYKIVYGAKEQAVTSLLLRSTRPLSSLRAHLFVALSRLIHLLYYRIWRLRIAPKLPFRISPLWRSWIRFRI